MHACVHTAMQSTHTYLRTRSAACCILCVQGRAVATMASRRQAHDAIRRLHGKETLAGEPTHTGGAAAELNL